MKQFKFRSVTCGLLGALLLLGAAAPITFTSCENEHPEINITLTSDYSGIIDAINATNKTLTDKLAAIEAALKSGFADEKTALGELKTALESIKGSVDGIDGAIDDIVASIDAITDALGDLNDTAGATNDALTGAIADALADIFDAIDGLSDYSEILEAIKTAIENIEITGGGDTPGGDTPGTINGHAYVEMGDGLKWATMNVGATKPEDYGDYFAWGETETKSDYAWPTYKWIKEGYSNWKEINKYTFADGQTDGIWYDGDTFVGDGKTSLKDYDYVDDAARQIWKGTWRIPTDAEWTWLRENCTWTWKTTSDGYANNGMLVTSKVSGYEGNSIFLPAAGIRNGNSPFRAGSEGDYWSSSLLEYSSGFARDVEFRSGEVDRSNFGRCYGFSVRAVSD